MKTRIPSKERSSIVPNNAANGKSGHSHHPPAPHEPDQNPPTPGERVGLRAILQAVKAVRRGDFAVRISGGQDGIIGEIGEALNDVIELNELMAKEFVRSSHMVGREGKMTERANIGPVKGGWVDCIESFN